MTTDTIETAEIKKDLEALLINNQDLSQISSHLSCFNPIKVMGMEKMEIRHSNILGWLLNPQLITSVINDGITQWRQLLVGTVFDSFVMQLLKSCVTVNFNLRNVKT